MLCWLLKAQRHGGTVEWANKMGMRQGAALDNDKQCWWCGAPIEEHGKSEFGLWNIGYRCDHERWLKEHEEADGRRLRHTPLFWERPPLQDWNPKRF